MAPADKWLKAVLYWKAQPWPKATRYELETSPQGEFLRGAGPLAWVNLPPEGVAFRLASWGTPAFPASKGNLERLVNELGLTTPWAFAADGKPWWTGDQPKRWMRPAWEQSLEDFRGHVRTIRNALEGYEILRSAQRDPMPADQTPTVLNAWRAFSRSTRPAIRKLLREKLSWGLSVATSGERRIRVTTDDSFLCSPPPSLFELAVAELVALFQDSVDVKRCALSECLRPFRGPTPGGTGERRWDRSDRRYCSRKCAQRAWYLTKDERPTGAQRKEGMR